MSPKNETKAVALPGEYAVLAMSDEDRDILKSNLGDGSLTQFDLPRVKVPSGGGTTWEIGDDAEKVLEGVIVGWHDSRQYWSKAYGSGESGPPECESHDLANGLGEPGGSCAACPFNQWGSAVKDDGSPGAGKACRETRALLIVRSGDILPLLLIVPPSSLKGLRRHFLTLASQRIPYWGVVSQLSLAKTKSSGGIDYAQVEVKRGATLDADESARMKAYASTLAGTIEAVAVSSDEAGS